MSYDYQTERPYVLTDEGQRRVFAVADFATRAIEMSGAVTAGKLMSAAGSGDSWKLMACVDRLVEIGRLREIAFPRSTWQERIFIGGFHV